MENHQYNQSLTTVENKFSLVNVDKQIQKGISSQNIFDQAEPSDMQKLNEIRKLLIDPYQFKINNIAIEKDQLSQFDLPWQATKFLEREIISLKRMFQEIKNDITQFQLQVRKSQSHIQQTMNSPSQQKKIISQQQQEFARYNKTFNDAFLKTQEISKSLMSLEKEDWYINLIDQNKIIQNFEKNDINYEAIMKKQTSAKLIQEQYQKKINELIIHNSSKIQEFQNTESQLKFINQQIKNSEDKIENLETECRKFEESIKKNNEEFTTNVLNQQIEKNSKEIEEKYAKILKENEATSRQQNQEMKIKQEKLYLIKTELKDKSRSFHFIFLLDDSGSMHDKLANNLWKLQFNKTSWDFVRESFEEFLKVRSTLNTSDLISVVKFADKAVSICKYKQISEKIDLQICPQKSGTNFNCAFEEAITLAKGKPYNLQQIIIFMTDGENQKSQDSQIQQQFKQLKSIDEKLELFAFGVGPSIDKQKLQQMSFDFNQNEIYGTGCQLPIPYFQHILVSDQMNKVFFDLAFNISSQDTILKSDIEKIKFQQENLVKEQIQQREMHIIQQDQELKEMQGKLKQKMDLLGMNNQENKTKLQDLIKDNKKQIEKEKKEIKQKQLTLVELKEKLDLVKQFVGDATDSKTKEQVNELKIQLQTKQKQDNDQFFKDLQTEQDRLEKFYRSFGFTNFQVFLDHLEGIEKLKNFIEKKVTQTQIQKGQLDDFQKSSQEYINLIQTKIEYANELCFQEKSDVDFEQYIINFFKKTSIPELIEEINNPKNVSLILQSIFSLNFNEIIQNEEEENKNNNKQQQIQKQINLSLKSKAIQLIERASNGQLQELIKITKYYQEKVDYEFQSQQKDENSDSDESQNKNQKKNQKKKKIKFIQAFTDKFQQITEQNDQKYAQLITQFYEKYDKLREIGLEDDFDYRELDLKVINKLEFKSLNKNSDSDQDECEDEQQTKQQKKQKQNEKKQTFKQLQKDFYTISKDINNYQEREIQHLLSLANNLTEFVANKFNDIIKIGLNQERKIQANELIKCLEFQYLIPALQMQNYIQVQENSDVSLINQKRLNQF